MNLTSPGFDEKEKILFWARENGQNDQSFCCNPLPKGDSFFQPFDNNDTIVEYGFFTIPELQRKLEGMWKNDSRMEGLPLVCSIAAFKARDKMKVRSSMQTTKEMESEFDLTVPDYVYVF